MVAYFSSNLCSGIFPIEQPHRRPTTVPATNRPPVKVGNVFGKEEISFSFATEDLVPDPAPFDHSRAAAFEERLVGTLNSGALCLMTSLGHRTGLFDVMADMPAECSEAI